MKFNFGEEMLINCLLYTSDAADDSLRVDLGGRRIIKKNKSSFSNNNIFISSNFLFWNSMFLDSAQYRSNSKRVISRIAFPIIQDHKSRIFDCINNDVIFLNNFLSKTSQ